MSSLPGKGSVLHIKLSDDRWLSWIVVEAGTPSAGLADSGFDAGLTFTADGLPPHRVALSDAPAGASAEECCGVHGGFGQRPCMPGALQLSQAVAIVAANC